jgi:hypothetical protein
MITYAPPVHDVVYGGGHFKVYHANKGEGFPGHDHLYSHAILCTSGTCAVRTKDKELIMDKNTQPVNLLPNKWHEIESLEDNTVYVIIFEEGKY